MPGAQGRASREPGLQGESRAGKEKKAGTLEAGSPRTSHGPKQEPETAEQRSHRQRSPPRPQSPRVIGPL